MWNYYAFGAAVAEVEVDTLSGNWQARRCDVVMDVGQTLNAAIDVGQVEGAFMQVSLLLPPPAIIPFWSTLTLEFILFLSVDSLTSIWAGREWGLAPQKSLFGPTRITRG